MPITKILVANRSEIAIRVFRAANELGIKTVAIYAEEDKLSLHRFKADEAYQVGAGRIWQGLGPIESYLSIDEVIRVARMSGADAIHPGYGLLSESPEFAEACAAAGIIFIGPTPETMRTLGNKVAARNLAIAVGVPVMPATEPLPDDMEAVKTHGRRDRLSGDAQGVLGRRRARHARRSAAEDELARRGDRRPSARRRPPSARTRSISKSWSSAPATSRCRSSATRTATLVHLFERDCSIQRRNQKVVERAPAPYLDAGAARASSASYALKIAARDRLCRRRHGRVPDGCRHRQILLHRGQSAHPGRAHRDRGGHRHRHRQGADPDRRGRGDRHAGVGHAARRRTSG